MTVLIHTCCAPCSIVVVEHFRKTSTSFLAYFHNPNIHPYLEYQRRLDTLKLYSYEEGFDLIVEPGYEPEAYFEAVTGNEQDRCPLCYRIRLQKAAEMAKQHGCEAFTSTLLYSKYQQHEAICEVAEGIAKKTGVNFYYQDFRDGWKRGIQESKRLGMYRQQYCGCLYSERDRYFGTASASTK